MRERKESKRREYVWENIDSFQIDRKNFFDMCKNERIWDEENE